MEVNDTRKGALDRTSLAERGGSKKVNKRRICRETLGRA